MVQVSVASGSGVPKAQGVVTTLEFQETGDIEPYEIVRLFPDIATEYTTLISRRPLRKPVPKKNNSETCGQKIHRV